MATDLWNLEKDFCRCCHAEGSEGSFQNLQEPCYRFGEVEVYGELLKTCFDLELEPIRGLLNAMTYTICDQCICRLREANSFRQQVIGCEMRFRAMYKTIIKGVDPCDVQVEVKQEMLPENYGDMKPEHAFQMGMPPKSEHIEVQATPMLDGFDNFDDDDNMSEDESLSVIQQKKPKSPVKPKAKTKTKAKPKPKSPKAAAAKPKPKTKKKAKDGEAAPQKGPNDPLYTLAKRRNGTMGYKCTTCKRAFYTKEGVLQHYQYQHINPDGFFDLITENGVSIYKCKMCAKDFKNIMNIRVHYKKVHLKMKSRTKCPACDKSLAPHRKAEHMERRHGIPAPTCGICGKKFAYAYELVKHQKVIHMGETYFKCSTCEMSFPTRGRLQKHEVKHSSVRMFTCDLCGKSFKWKKCLTQHIEIHLDIRKYFCKICPASFVHCTGMKYHMAKKHPNVESYPPPPPDFYSQYNPYALPPPKNYEMKF